MNIAIIGAGVSGLTTAYYLNKLRPDISITIYEKSGDVGGNADTILVQLPDGKGGYITRWVDMGVNDFNMTTYQPLKEIWKELNLLNNNIPCPSNDNYCKPLRDTESFATSDFNYRYMINEDGSISVPPGSSASKTLLEDGINKFKKDLGDWYKENSEEGKNTMTVGQFVVQQGYSQEFIFGNLYPRINGMYFTMEDPNGQGNPPPAQMPLWMVAHYYLLQEGYGIDLHPSLQCKRQYFVNGSRTWLRILADNLRSKGVKIYFNVPPITISRDSGKMLMSIQGGRNYFDKVVFGTHADDTYNMMPSLQGEPMVAQLPNFSFSGTQVTVHQDPTFLGPRRDVDATYNIHIYNYNESLPSFPYSISYIVNYHQNDPASGINNPLFFLSISPYWPLNQSAILRRTQDGLPAQTVMRHCKLDQASMKAQVEIERMQLGKGQPPLDYYFAGSFTRGAGLHLECISHAKDIANRIANPYFESEDIYDFNEKSEKFAPKYIRYAIQRLKNSKEETVA